MNDPRQSVTPQFVALSENTNQLSTASEGEAELYRRGYAMMGAADISNYLAKCGSVPQMESDLDRMREALKRLEAELLSDGDPFSGDDWGRMRVIRWGLGLEPDPKTIT